MPLKDTNEWFDSVPQTQRPVLDVLRELVLAAGPGVVEQFKWSRPCYAINDELFCYLHRTKNHVTLGFQRGTDLPDPDNLLEGEGKGMRHIKFTTAKEAQKASVKKLIKQAAKLNS